MNIVAFLVGLQGSGKTTILDRIRLVEELVVLTPSTTRKKRFRKESEYDFVKKWDSEIYAWEIEVGGEKYGMRKTELQRVENAKFAFTLFDPGSIEALQSYRESTGKTTITIGLDTVQSLDEQSGRRDGHGIIRLQDDKFKTQVSAVRNCDLVLKGSPDAIFEAILATVECLQSRGGVVHKTFIEKFLAAGAFLDNANDEVSPASYDLRLGDDVWCQGKFIKLTEESPALRIPAYSYAIVSALETANLPVFVSARFGLKNSLFFQGVVQSNGPQIDPGYCGALFCMLYNGSDQPVGLMRGTHFSTIEFITTCGFGSGYRDKYQGMTALCDFMPAGAAVSEGGQILEKTENKIATVAKEWTTFRNTLLAVMALIVSPTIFIAFGIWSKWQDTKIDIDQTIVELHDLEDELTVLINSLQVRRTETPDTPLRPAIPKVEQLNNSEQPPAKIKGGIEEGDANSQQTPSKSAQDTPEKDSTGSEPEDPTL